MSRKKLIIIELAAFLMLTFIFLRFNSYYLSGEALLHANERGLHYSPSTEVLLEHREGTNILMIGSIDNRSISVIQGKKFGPLYKLRGGGITGHFMIHREEEAAISAFSVKDSLLFGLVDKERYPECTKVVCEFEIKSNSTEGEPVYLEAEVPENGVFLESDPDIRAISEDEWINIMNVKGYDSEGEFLFSNY